MEAQPTHYNDRIDRLIFGAAIIAGNVGGLILLAFVQIPEGNETVFGGLAGGLSAAVGIITAATWKTNATERAQQDTISQLAGTAAAAAAPMTTTTTTTVEKGDGPGTSGSATTGDSGLDTVALVRGGGAADPTAEGLPDDIPVGVGGEGVANVPGPGAVDRGDAASKR